MFDPKYLSVALKTIPARLIKYAHWVVWNEKKTKAGRPPKILLQAINGQPASVKDPETWCDFKTLLKYYEDYDGIGFVVTKTTGIVAWDLNYCRNPYTRVIESWAIDIIRRLNSYTEVTPSGKGIRILTISELWYGKKISKRSRVYDRDHYVTVTGCHLGGTPNKIRKRQTATEEIYQKEFGQVFHGMSKLFD